MAGKAAVYRGCLLGLAVGDAMGYTVDGSSWDQIREDYGPNGLLGYDLVNGYAEISSHTQLAAFACNGLLLGLTRGQMQGRMAPFVRYVGLAAKEWAQTQRYRSGPPPRTFCWVARVKELCSRRCMDTLMLDTLTRERTGSLEDRVNRFDSPGMLLAAVSVGLFADMGKITAEEADRLGAEVVALTHGSPMAFLSGAMTANIIRNLLRMPEVTMDVLVEGAMARIRDQFGPSYPQTEDLWQLLRLAKTLAASENVETVEAMERIGCRSAAECLAGAVYACLVSGDDFDTAMITAVNHSGCSAAVGALTGAILGAKLGQDALPEFYLECLEPASYLAELADDLAQGCPMDLGSAMFDDDWDRKYVHGGG